MQRKIIHIDMDCFYAAVELRDRPELRGKPVAVGGAKRRGVLTTCNYEARKFGCRSGMPGFKALELCPDLILLPVNLEKYTFESQRIREIFLDYTNVIEPLSLDEAYLDVSEHKERFAWDIAKEIRTRIFETTELTASAGVAPNKMLAKIASDWRKPNGQFAVLPDDVEDFMKLLSVGKISGVGKKTRERLAVAGIHTCGDLQQFSEEELNQKFGKFGSNLYLMSRGIDSRPVAPHRVRKSMSTERTYPEDLTAIEQALAESAMMIDELRNNFQQSRHKDRTIAKIFVKLKFSDFKSTTKECLHDEIDTSRYDLLIREAWLRGNEAVRLIGVGIRFATEEEKATEQMSFEMIEADV
ncbi:MAG: DNA polymerase IV [Opitutales bacterium]|nr:DNA polymerase IV [Opitutales bacterium]